MQVNRRSAIKQFLIVSAGITFLHSCKDDNKPSIVLKNIDITRDDEQLLAELSETIIPHTDTPGAKDLSAHLFALKMLDDCAKKDEQHRFISGMKNFENMVKSMTGKPFIDCNIPEKAKILTALENRKTDDDLSFFYGAHKSLIVQAYTTSKFFLTQVREYKLVPGKYKGCVPVKA